MYKLRLFCVTAAAISVFGCGSTDNGGTTIDSSIPAAAPSFDTVSLDLNANATSAPLVAEQTQALSGEGCHPHLFLRVFDAIVEINHMLKKIFGRIDLLIDTHPRAVNGQTYIWGGTTDNGQLTVQVKLTKASSTQWTLEIDAKKPTDPDTAYVVVATATLNTTDGQPHTGSGSFSENLTALHGLLPSVETAGGTVAVNYNVTGANKKVQVQLTNYTSDLSNPGKLPGNANFVYGRTKNVGGSFKWAVQVGLLCPEQPADAGTPLLANLQSVHQWTVTVDGGVVSKFQGRTDAQANGGQIAAADRWVGVTCSDLTATPASAERYWALKVEHTAADGGVTVPRFEVSTTYPDAGNSCDPVFQPLPGKNNTSNDYAFGSINFTDSSVAPFPGKPDGGF